MKNDVAEQLAISSEEPQFIRAELSSKPPLQPICHRFSAQEFWNEAETKARFSALVPALSRQGFDVDAAGGAFVEAWGTRQAFAGMVREDGPETVHDRRRSRVRL